MKTWKRLLGCLLAGTMLLSMAACGSGNSSSDGQTNDQNQAETTPAENTAPETTAPETTAPEAAGDESQASGGNVLVVYYSASGHTETVANYIAEATGGDLFEITPVEQYTSDDLNWTDENSRVSREHED